MQHIHTLTHQRQARRYLVHVPPRRQDVPLSLVLVLHGAGGTAAWTLGETHWQDTADQHGFLLVLPEGTRADPDKPPGFLKNPQVWNDGGPRAILGLPDTDDVGFLNAVLDDVLSRFPVDPRRVYATGFSNGGGMVFRLAAASSERFAAIAPVAGLCVLEPPLLTKPLPTLYLLGAQDPLIPLDGGHVLSPWTRTEESKPAVRETLQRWAAALGCSTEPSLLADQDGVRELLYGPSVARAELRVFLIDGLGHHWPGGRGQLNPRLAGSPSTRLIANEVIWRYFVDHQPI